MGERLDILLRQQQMPTDILKTIDANSDNKISSQELDKLLKEISSADEIEELSKEITVDLNELERSLIDTLTAAIIEGNDDAYALFVWLQKHMQGSNFVTWVQNIIDSSIGSVPWRNTISSMIWIDSQAYTEYGLYFLHNDIDIGQYVEAFWEFHAMIRYFQQIDSPIQQELQHDLLELLASLVSGKNTAIFDEKLQQYRTLYAEQKAVDFTYRIPKKALQSIRTLSNTLASHQDKLQDIETKIQDSSNNRPWPFKEFVVGVLRRHSSTQAIWLIWSVRLSLQRTTIDTSQKQLIQQYITQLETIHATQEQLASQQATLQTSIYKSTLYTYRSICEWNDNTFDDLPDGASNNQDVLYDDPRLAYLQSIYQQ